MDAFLDSVDPGVADRMESIALQKFANRLQFVDDFESDPARNAQWASAVSGGVAAVATANRSVWRFSTTSGVGYGAKTRSATSNLHKPYKTTGSPRVQIQAALGDAAPDNVKVGFGLAGTLAGAGQVSSADFIGFTVLSGDSGTNFVAMCSKTGSGRTVLDTGVTLTTDWTIFEFRVRSTSQVEFYINKVSVGLIETNVPTVDLQRVIALVNIENNINTLDVDSFAAFTTRAPS